MWRALTIVLIGLFVTTAALASTSCATSFRLLPPAGVSELQARAEAGVPGAQFNLGVMYAEGRGVSQDDATAARWYQLAAAQGYPREP